MKKFYFLLTFFVSLCIILPVVGCSDDDNNGTDEELVVTIYENAVIYTVDDELPTAEVMVVKDGKIEYIGNDKGAEKFYNPAATVVNVNGKTILPGMIESHAHPASVGVLNAGNVFELGWDADLETIQNTVRAFLAEYPDSPHAIGVGFATYSLGLPEGETPTAADLDIISTEIPIMLYDAGLHSLWANSKALEIAKIDENTEDPVPGISYYVRYPGTNIPTGFIYEMAGHALIDKQAFNVVEVVAPALMDFLDYFAQLGITGVFDAGTIYGTEIEAIAEIENRDLLKMYYQKSFVMDQTLNVFENVERIKAFDAKYTKGNLYCNIYKMFEDGTVEVENAALLKPYSSGIWTKPFLTQEETNEHVSTVLQAGYGVHIHAIGDLAQQQVLNAYLNAKDINPHLTRTIAHNQMFDPQGIEKYKQMKKNIFCQSTPSWTTDECMYEAALLVGTERASEMYLWGQLIEEDVKVTFGSDYPASPLEDINPFVQIYHAVMRGKDPSYMPPLEAGVKVEEAVKAYTINGALQLGLGDITGSLKTGKYADFIVIDRDIMKVDAQQIIDTQVEQTYFQGELVFSK